MARRAAASSRTRELGPHTRILVLHGRDAMAKREALAGLREALEAEAGEAELVAFDGKSAPLADVLDELRSFSLMQRAKIVVVDDADVFLTRKYSEQRQERTFREAMERYAAEPIEHATLVLRAERWNRGNLDKLIEKMGAIRKCEPPTAAQAVQWVVQRAPGAHGVQIEARAAQALVDRLGADRMMLDNELAKLALLAEGGVIEAASVEQLVGRSSEEDAWAIQEAVLAVLAAPSGAARAATQCLLDKVHELVELSRQPKELVAYFAADAIRKLVLALNMKAQGAPEAAIAREMKLWGPRQELFMSALRRLSPARAHALLDRILDLDARSKSGLGQTVRNLEGFCATLADESR